MQIYQQFRQALYLMAMLLLFFCGFALAQTNYWEQTNGPVGGSVSDMVFRSSSAMFAVYNDNQLYYTSDAGANWQEAALPDSIGDVRAMTLDPAGNLWLADLGGNLYRSDDNGDSWSQVSGPAANEISVLSITFTGGDTLLLGTNDGVFRSPDGGQSWQNFWAGKIFLETIQTGSGILISNIFDMNNPLAPVRIYRSTDNGENWVATTALPGPFVGGITVNGNDEILAVLQDQPKVYRSPDNGATWTELSQGIAAGFQPGNILSSGAPGDNQLYLSGLDAEYRNKVYHSTDNGASWALVPHDFDQYIRFIKMNDAGEVFLGTGRGIARSTDQGASWAEINGGIVATAVQSMAVDADNRLHAVVAGRGIVSSDDQGATWETLYETPAFLTGLKIAADGTMFGLVFYGQELLRSTDHGATWEDLMPNMPAGTRVVSIGFLPNGDLLAGGANKILRSSDNGNSWATLANVPNPNPQMNEEHYVHIHPSGDIFLVPVTFTAEGIYRSTDNGATWAQSSNGISQPEQINGMFIDDNGTMFVGITVYDAPNTGPYLYRSTDTGATWEDSGNGIQLEDEGSVTAIIAAGSDYYVGTTSDLYRSTDNGASWTSVKAGLQLSFEGVKALAVDHSGRLFAGTPPYGVFRSTGSLTAIDDAGPMVVEAFSLAQNYPNPFNPSTTISFTIGNAAHITLTVYDVLGRKVETLVDRTLAPGTYRSIFNAGDLAGGTYFYRLQAGDYAQTRKLTLVK